MPLHFVFDELESEAWYQSLRQLARTMASAAKPELDYRRLFSALVRREVADLSVALAEGLLWLESPLSRAAMRGRLSEGLLAGAEQDLESMLALVRRDWVGELNDSFETDLPKLSDLAPPPDSAIVTELAGMVCRAETAEILERLLAQYREHGAGILARYQAFRWSEGMMEGVSEPSRTDHARLVGLESQLGRLRTNVERWLEVKPAHHTLLYGPRGSGKSTAVRGLLSAYASEGLRLVELPLASFPELPLLLEQLRHRPHHYLVYVDDLSFDTQDHRYAPLKTLLEGSLTLRPDNVLLIATSNRRHLLKEQFKDRPDPLDDDVHAWDTQHEKLALADRFGMVITFPNADQRRYLAIVDGLASELESAPADLHERALRFADWGNGYSGRTAQQFIDSLHGETG